MPEKTTPQPTDIHRFVLISVLIVAVSLGIFFLTRRKAPDLAPTNQTPAGIAAVTPRSFTMISGSIAGIDAAAKTINTDFSYIDETGKNKTKRYAITVGATTQLQAVDQATTPALVSTITFEKLAVGDRIEVLGDTNLAPLDAFTASTILQYPQ